MADTKSKYPPRGPQQQGGFKEFLYNTQTGAVMGRTGSSWFKIVVFYIIFYLGLAAFFSLYFYLFWLTLNMDEPKWKKEESLIGTNPGLGYRPMPDPDMAPDSTLIWFRRKIPADYEFWSKQLEEFVDKIETGKSSGSVNLQSCTLENGKRATRDQACQVDVKNFQTCQKNNEFGYRLGEPCILIKLNKIYDWVPHPYGYETVDSDRFSEQMLRDDLDKEVREKGMPEDLKWHILNETQRHYNNDAVRRMLLSTVWIHCDGENVADKENVGAIDYFPMRGIAGYYFPFMKQLGYQPPFIFVQLKNPVPGVVINVECKAFAKNVKPDKMFKLATTHFEILID